MDGLWFCTVCLHMKVHKNDYWYWGIYINVFGQI